MNTKVKTLSSKKKKKQISYFLTEYQLHCCTIPINILR